MTQELLAWDAHAATWQPVRNERPIPHRRAQVSSGVPVPVTARVVWEHDGVEEIDTVVWAWTSRSVLVELHDVRRQTIGLWLPARDVRRRRPTTNGNT
ncbi:hypothetical protein SAMN05216184_11269 [Georgenia satyanarayanai]|uniref:Uncharacterized protein n=1 Tax=Georgenia satyanarayanai TaxID=860221 RepID=A0A2Y9ALK6_9MICO|nr:hypothetical protein [Georgenia satyanarayanai]PYF98325.1 hypothetical protein A8987_11269 [Georgenia satyanarayanai]SSA45210.1 hypothetical protein SAMN05216184_11269 [Georgenia satyanarayanai]